MCVAECVGITGTNFPRRWASDGRLHQILAADFRVRITAKRNYNIDGRNSDGNSKTLVDMDGDFGYVCEAGSSSVEFHSDDGHRTVYGKSCSGG